MLLAATTRPLASAVSIDHTQNDRPSRRLLCPAGSSRERFI